MADKPAINTEYKGCFNGLRARPQTRWIVIHHTCTATPAQTRKELKRKGYSTHFEVDRDGTIYQYADLDRMCSHCGSGNFQSIGVDLTHLKDADWPQVQLDAAERLFRWLSDELGIPWTLYAEMPSGFVYHRAISNTVCPQNFPGEEVFGDTCEWYPC